MALSLYEIYGIPTDEEDAKKLARQMHRDNLVALAGCALIIALLLGAMVIDKLMEMSAPAHFT